MLFTSINFSAHFFCITFSRSHEWTPGLGLGNSSWLNGAQIFEWRPKRPFALNWFHNWISCRRLSCWWTGLKPFVAVILQWTHPEWTPSCVGVRSRNMDELLATVTIEYELLNEGGCSSQLVHYSQLTICKLLHSIEFPTRLRWRKRLSMNPIGCGNSFLRLNLWHRNWWTRTNFSWFWNLSQQPVGDFMLGWTFKR